MDPQSRFSVISKDKLKIYDSSLLGSGGFGFVVKAKHVDWSMDVAVKCICSKQTMTEKQQKDLYLEAEKLEAARFRYVIHFYGMCIEPTFYCLIMDMAENGSLKSLLGVDIPWALRWRIAFETAIGMNYLHNLAPRILHCDLKSENICLDEEYHVKITDFGLSKWKSITGATSIGNQGEVGGTATHIPPESWEDVNCKPDTPWDVYSYGIVLWEILTRRQPFEHAHNSAHIEIAVRGNQRPDQKLIPTEPQECADFSRLMRQCWSQKPDDRPSFKDCVDRIDPIYRNYKQEVPAAIAALQSGSSSNNTAGSRSSVSSIQGKLGDLKLEDVVRHYTGRAAPQLDEAVPIQVQSAQGGQQHQVPQSAQGGQYQPTQDPQGGQYQPTQDPQGGQYQPTQDPQGGQKYQAPPAGGAWGGGQPPWGHNIPGLGAGANFNLQDCQNVIIGNNNVITVNNAPTQPSSAKRKNPPAQKTSAPKVSEPGRQVTNKMLQVVASHIGRDWKKLARELDMTEPQIDQIQYDYHHEGLQEITYQMMIKWKQQNGKRATVGKLAQAFSNIDKGYLAKHL
ncbi:PREDICTED: receptor-interacting serine/threonine-protein kinase 3-like isoform X1 [Branchiostoma belcheri]|uniref:Receptor-interacting serine/threonine-protein kinase 3-like isoform X1 n=1 Tax=Branchiostoma belcheri TaxID=7741 RepID=A0A6P4ZEL1_BRABE|nr:PREDICTED: receptor-interacting serine/threonine-protein kinase 3-like isoform X1 [Branchiostoma belcheri]XP_019629561.1 PREDICTED: receptor-interacting serine/threonine-protein kinase 3-like isoform X1 [Branchiostoma belcheri]XP_019629562.1 PREDICTED: receptor-interacting serine/threonine-protein kinase 3-like isoform X1 [Branchiostoma belcheri]